MAIGVGNLVGASDYNAIHNKIKKVLGDDGSDPQVGYGRTLESSPVSVGDVIDASLIDSLYNDLVRARTHQRGTNFTWDTPDDGINAPDAGEYIGAFAADLGTGGTSADATRDVAEGFLDFAQAAQDIDDDKYAVGADQTSYQVLKTSTRTSAWNGTITHIVDVVWSNNDEGRYFFNSGGYIQFDAVLTGGNTVSGNQTATYPSSPAYQKDEIWQTMLNTMGSIRFGRTGTSTTGSGSARADIGAYDINETDDRQIFIKEGSGVYSENFYKIQARLLPAVAPQTAPNKIRFTITFSDSDLGDNRDADLGFPGEGTPVDENVTGTITSTVSCRTATGALGLSHPGSQSISVLEGSNPASYTLIATGSVDEGSNLNITLNTSNVPNGTNVPYTITGISSADLVSGDITGNFNIQNNTRTLTFNIKADSLTEGTETLVLALNNGEAEVSVDISDISKTPKYTLTSSPATADEGTVVSFTLTTENVNPGSFAYTITGINADDLSAGLLTDVITTSGTYANASGSVSITLANDLTTEDEETITFTAAGKTTTVTVNDTSTTPVLINSAIIPSRVTGSSSVTCPSGTGMYALLEFGGDGQLERFRSIPMGCSNETTILGDWLDSSASADDYDIKVTVTDDSNPALNPSTIVGLRDWTTFSPTGIITLGLSDVKTGSYYPYVDVGLRIQIRRNSTGDVLVNKIVRFEYEAT